MSSRCAAFDAMCAFCVQVSGVWRERARLGHAATRGPGGDFFFSSPLALITFVFRSRSLLQTNLGARDAPGCLGRDRRRGLRSRR